MTGKEQRHARIMINKAGGNASKNAVNYRVTIPSVWATALAVTSDDRDVLLTFDGEKITIEKAKALQAKI